ncbi:alginate O-acetyltransferase AlgX-related protein [Azospirillum argentinense]|uniref:alginate O-acetyltransferase AlgX-related protein n=1 Tax=Azospirillum argentinense TaxID=2970906 RepID=UPI0032DF2F19
MMTTGLIGTFAVIGGFLPEPRMMPADKNASRFANSFFAKDQLLTTYRWVRSYFFHVFAPTTILGEDGWIYYRSDAIGDGSTISDFMGFNTPSQDSLNKMKQHLIDRRQHLSEQSIRYLPFVPPNTVTIYPEYLPKEIREAYGRTRLDAVMDAMQEEILDLRPALLQRKTVERVYDNSDTHWSDLGAFTAYEVVTQRLIDWFPSIRPIKRSDLVERHALRNRELQFMFGAPQPTTFLEAPKPFPSRCADTGEPVLAPGSIREIKDVNPHPRNWVWLDSECPSRRFIQDNQALPKAIVFHDSFFIMLNPYFSQNFRDVLYVLGPFDQSLVLKERPDVVIDEATERYLHRLFN